MSKIFIASIMMLVCFRGFSQTLTVIDRGTLQPLQSATIYSLNPPASAVTNSSGNADISSFKNADAIFIRFIGYNEAVYSYAQLEAIGFKVRLAESALALDEVVISANRFEEKKSDVPQQIQVIKAKQLEFMSQQTTADVMQNSGNILVQKSQQGGGSPIIRGFETNKVLMVVDGVRMNNAIYRGGHLQNIITLDNSVMDKIEIVFGPGSVIYGSDALGGVMHFYTRSPLLADSAGLKVKANAYFRYSTANNENTSHVDFSLGGKKFGALSSITFSDFDDLRQGNNRNPFYGDWGKRLWYAERIGEKDSMIMNNNPLVQRRSGYSQYDVLQKFLFKQSESIDHTLNLQYSTSSNIPRYDRLTLMQGANPRFAEWYYGPQERMFASYSVSLKNNSHIYDNAKFIVGYQQIEESRHDRRFNHKTRRHRTENLDIVTFNADLAKKIQKHEIRYGLDGWHNQVSSSAFREDINTGEKQALDTRYPDGGSSMQSAAAYLSHSFEINKNLILSDGIRVNWVELAAQFNDTTFFPFPFSRVTQKNTALNGNIGLVWMPGADWRFSLAGSSGFRAPNIDDLSKVFESVPGRVIVPNPNLKPEYTYNADLGFSKTINKQVTFGGTSFYTIYKNAITVMPGKFDGNDSIIYSGQLSKVTSAVNASEAYLYGFSAFLNADVTSNFSIVNSLNYTYGRIKTDSTDYPLDHIPPVFGKSSFMLKLTKFTGEFFILYNGEKKSWDYNLLGEDNHAYSADPVKGYMPAWYTLNLRTGYQLNRYLALQLALENILDQHYRVFASNISGAGRNFMVTLRGKF